MTFDLDARLLDGVLPSGRGSFKAARHVRIIMLNLLRKSAARKQRVQALYDDLVMRARAPLFFQGFAVADTIDGRFDLIALHGWLAMSHLGATRQIEDAQGLTDALFAGFDEALREQGAGDMSLGRRIKAMGDAFFGRLQAYDAARAPAELSRALAKNLYRGSDPGALTDALAAYTASARATLAASPEGRLDFGPLPVLP